jgi:hypothetical protein
MNQFGLQYICAREQHKKSPYIASLSQTSKNVTFLLLYFMFFFYKIKEYEVLIGSD